MAELNPHSARQLFVLEFNELCPSLLNEFMARGLLPNFRRLYESSAVFTTDAGEASPHLEPWIQWPTVHTGVPFAEHGAFHLGEGRRIAQTGVAEVLSNAGARVGICCSMNMNYGRLNGYMIPDPWSSEAAPYPEWLVPFFTTVAQQVQESSRDVKFPRSQMVRFGTFMLKNGLSLGTVRAIVSQLWSERRDPGLRWRRAVLLDRLQYDLFRSLNRRFRVQFATLFLNSTAHFQHYYWRNMEPEDFAVPPGTSDHPSLRRAVLYGYQSMDWILGRTLSDFPDAVVVLCSALSQQAWHETTKCTYRPVDFERLLELAGIPPESAAIKPVMSEEFRIEFTDSEAARAAEARLAGLRVDDKPLMRIERDGASLFAGCAVFEAIGEGKAIRPAENGRSVPFAELFHLVHSMRSGRHHPDGVLWIRTGEHEVQPEPVPLIDVAPTILAYFGIDPPEQMPGSPLLVWGRQPAVAA